MADDDDGRPSFAEVVKAVTPPGTDWEEFKAAMRQAHLTGGHQPSRLAPDISYSPQAGPGEPAAPPPGRASASLPADPFAPMTQGAIAATAMHETFRDMLAGGFTEDQATTILAKMLAFHHGGGPDG